MNKYHALGNYLKKQGHIYVKLSFEKIEEIIGSKLPESAYRYRAWWENSDTHIQAKNGWLNAGYRVDAVDFNKRKVTFVKINIDNAKDFEELARCIMSEFFGVELKPRKKRTWPKKFDMVSPDYRIVGDAKFYKMVKNVRRPSAKLDIISAHVWMLENTDADIQFLVFGNDERVPKEWLKRYGKFVKKVKFYFIDKNNKLKELL